MTRLHLLYCLIFSFLIIGAGAATIRTPQDFVFQFLFLPVPLFFLTAFIKTLRRKNETSEVSRKTGIMATIFSLALFLVLLAAALSNILWKK